MVAIRTPTSETVCFVPSKDHRLQPTDVTSTSCPGTVIAYLEIGYLYPDKVQAIRDHIVAGSWDRFCATWTTRKECANS